MNRINLDYFFAASLQHAFLSSAFLAPSLQHAFLSLASPLQQALVSVFAFAFAGVVWADTEANDTKIATSDRTRTFYIFV